MTHSVLVVVVVGWSKLDHGQNAHRHGSGAVSVARAMAAFD
jgi:hypothetical protein